MLRPGTFALTALLAGLSAVGPLTTDMYLPSLPDIARLLGATTAQGAAHHLVLSDRLRRRPDRLRSAVRPARPQAGAALRGRALRRGEPGLRAVELDRNADRGALCAGARRLRRHRAGARHGARSLCRQPRGPRIVGDRRGDGAGAGAGADRRRHPADRLRLALGVLRAGRRRPGGRRRRRAAAAGDAGAARGRAGLACPRSPAPTPSSRATRPISPIWGSPA